MATLLFGKNICFVAILFMSLLYSTMMASSLFTCQNANYQRQTSVQCPKLFKTKVGVIKNKKIASIKINNKQKISSTEGKSEKLLEIKRKEIINNLNEVASQNWEQEEEIFDDDFEDVISGKSEEEAYEEIERLTEKHFLEIEIEAKELLATNLINDFDQFPEQDEEDILEAAEREADTHERFDNGVVDEEENYNYSSDHDSETKSEDLSETGEEDEEDEEYYENEYSFTKEIEMAKEEIEEYDAKFKESKIKFEAMLEKLQNRLYADVNYSNFESIDDGTQRFTDEKKVRNDDFLMEQFKDFEGFFDELINQSDEEFRTSLDQYTDYGGQKNENAIFKTLTFTQFL